MFLSQEREPQPAKPGINFASSTSCVALGMSLAMSELKFINLRRKRIRILSSSVVERIKDMYTMPTQKESNNNNILKSHFK